MSSMTTRERQRRTYDVAKEKERLAVCKVAETDLRRARSALKQVGADAAANAIRVALKSVGGAIRHAEHRIRFAEAKAEGERKARAAERCVHGKHLPHAHAGGVCLLPRKP